MLIEPKTKQNTAFMSLRLKVWPYISGAVYAGRVICFKSREPSEDMMHFLEHKFRGGAVKPEDVSFRSFCPFHEKHLL